MQDAPATAPIVCPVTKWYFGRLLKLGAMFLVFGAWFYKDGAWSWPKENRIAAERERYAKEVTEPFEAARKAGTLAAWQAEAKARGTHLNGQGEPLTWAGYAAKHGWPEKPKKRPELELQQQFYWSGGMFAGVLVVGLVALLNRRKKLIGHADHFVLPNGTVVKHADAFKIDKRPWDLKGLAYVHYRAGGTGPARKAVIDDLKFAGAARVLEQLLASFHGELIEKAEEPEEPVPSDESKGNAGS